MKSVGMRIREIREKKEWSLEKLAKKINVSKGYMSKLETGQKPINLKNLHLIANALDVDVTDLFPNKEKVENPLTHEEDWVFVVSELKERGFSAADVYLKMAQEEIEKDKKNKVD